MCINKEFDFDFKHLGSPNIKYKYLNIRGKMIKGNMNSMYKYLSVQPFIEGQLGHWEVSRMAGGQYVFYSVCV